MMGAAVWCEVQPGVWRTAWLACLGICQLLGGWPEVRADGNGFAWSFRSFSGHGSTLGEAQAAAVSAVVNWSNAWDAVA